MSRIVFTSKNFVKPKTVERHFPWTHHYLWAVICRSRGGLSANEKDETFALNDNNRYSWYYFSFSPDFQFRDLRKINEENETIKWEWWIYVSCICSLAFSVFATFKGTLGTRGFSRVRRVTIKTWQKPETALEKSLAPRVFQGKRKTWNRYSRCYFLFVSDFQFRDLLKINKENESIKWEQLLMRMINLCNLLFAFSFRHFQAVFQALF